MAAYIVRPLTDRTWLRPAGSREPSRFGPASGQSRAQWWARTTKLLLRELEELDARDVVLGLGVQERDLRLDGMLRADARPDSPAVELAFDSKHGPLLYRSDRFDGSAPAYQHNVRAIALTLEALRSVDRYGATASGQQYAGWKALGSAPADVAPDPVRVLADLAGISDPSGMSLDTVIGRARRRAHPDHGGTVETWHAFTAAAELLGG